MNEIKRCPHCGWDAQIQIDVRNSYVSVELLCDGCDAIFKCSQRLDEELMKEKTIPEVVNECLSDVLERWNSRAEEPQERKESNIEWLVKNNPNERCFCELAYETKNNGYGCEGLRDKTLGICDSCGFRDAKATIDYLLEAHKDKEND